MRLLLATTNPDKVREIAALLEHAPVTLLSLRDFPAVQEPEENGTTFEANARLKALYYERRIFRLKPEATGEQQPEGTGQQEPDGSETTCTVAEDSGLVVDALDGEPGVHSARFVRPDASYPERFAEIYRRLREHPDRPWTARFVCALAVVQDGRTIFETTGVVDGEIARAPEGSGGFGYDPIFYYPPCGTTLADVPRADKLRVAHRGQAVRALARWIRERSG